MKNNNEIKEDLNKKYTSLLLDYEKKEARLDRIIKQSDKQQLQMLKLNEELDIYKTQLESKVEEKTKELRELNENLELRVQQEVEENRQKDKHIYDQSKFVQLGELIGNIAHQWRQPLNAISTSAGSIQVSKMLGNTDEKQEEDAIQSILDTTQNLSKIIDSFRDFVNQTDDVSNVILQDLLDTNISIVSSSLDNDNISIVKQFHNTNIDISTLPSSLSQVIMNILKNAQEALIKVDSDKTKEIVVILNSYDKNNIEIIIKDNANGIPEAMIEKVFDPYFTTKHQASGVGLSLFIARESMQKHLNGDIEVNSSSKGTEFIIKLSSLS